MANIFTINKHIEKLSGYASLSTHQAQFIDTLLKGQPGDNGWRPFINIAKNPPVENKRGRIQAALTFAIQQASFWDFAYWYKLKRMENALTSKHPLDEKIKQIDVLIKQERRPEYQKKLAPIKKELALKLPNTNEIDHLVKVLDNEIKKTRFLDFTYWRTLKRIRADIHTFQQHQIHIWTRIQTPTAHKKLNKLNALYHETTSRFNGTAMLAMSQGFDPRLSESKGECFGYAAYWIQCMLRDKPFFNTTSTRANPIQRVSFDSAVWQRYPDFNNHAVLTKDISIYQALQAQKTKLLKALSSGDFHMVLERSETHWFNTPEEAASRIIGSVDHPPFQSPSTPFMIAVQGYLSGHALSFCKKNDKYHFFDSNFGWIAFDNAHDFTRWFPVYFKKMGYSALFHEITIEAAQKTPSPQHKNEPSITSKVLALTLFLPIVLCVVLCALTYMFIIRGLHYAKAHLKSTVQEYFNRTKEDEIIPSSSPKLITKKLPTRATDDLDLFLTQKKSSSSSSVQHASSAGLLFTTCEQKPKPQRNVVDALDAFMLRKTSANGLFAPKKAAPEDIVHAASHPMVGG